ncbi:hypothetical protein N780_20100 [Pontibacillus chungwhensis BH030062]|uniref:DUF4352 domain-containing protein n=1 Tax=Pontibacillus chungwhensis BH030062 TaxID=1385513 RepID=A0A0A2UXP4_9BACI|nr:hypothetical protein [Pontibacillus chungwhensis]KGP91528.1 hypothetical protein N780_20100 [Pontibacillus chungwhensis BH030062]
MKKIWLAVVLLLMMTACSEAEAMKIGKKTEGGEVDVSLNKTFTAAWIRKDKVTGLGEFTVSDYKVMENLADDPELNKEYNFMSMNVKLENVGDSTLSKSFFDPAFLGFYDKNGKEVKLPFLTMENDGTYEEAELRPGGVNEGTVIIPFEKGTELGEMVYSPNALTLFGSKFLYSFHLE